MNPIKSLFGHNDAIREVRAASLRFVALAVLFANLTVGDSQASFITHLVVTVTYLVVSVASVLAAIYLPSRSHLATTFTLTDAGLVIVVLYEHIVASPISENHNLTTSSLVIAFVMLNHVAFKLNKRLVVLFSTTVISAWLVMLAVTAYRHRLVSPGAILDSFFGQELALTASFTFTAFSVYMLAKEHDRTRRIAVRTEERRLNLSRFFSPTVIADLQEASQVLDLERREAAIMFVDIRNFTSYSENASPRELAKVLSEYRRIVAGTVFAHGGTVDKFIGDGVMAVFGQPKPCPDDAERALSCAIELMGRLATWHCGSLDDGGPALGTGIGLHFGTVIGGVLESGFHDEFTVIGDAVNVAQRLEALAKSLGSPLVVSAAIFSKISCYTVGPQWGHRRSVNLTGRRERIDVSYIKPKSLHGQ